MSTSIGGGYCDCGDTEAWKDHPYCAVHGEIFVIQLYIRVSVVLSRQHSRKEREKLDINLDRHSFSFGSLGNLVNL